MTVLFDRATISGSARITPEGYFVADALVARANNIQDYRAAELGITDRDPNDIIRVFRPEAEVFAADSVASAVRLPITLDHPVKNGEAVMVDATNWREFTRGQTDAEVLRDGEFMRIPLRITDAEAVNSVTTDRKEFSLGYSATIRMEPGEYNGQAYDAVAGNFRYNHLAACRAARGGPELKIVDERPHGIGAKPVKIVLVDNLPVDVENATAAEATISHLVATRDAAVQDCRAAQGTVAERDATIVAKDAELATLRDQLAAATLTPAQLKDAAASFGRTVASAQRLGATVTDEMDEPAVKAAAVKAKMGDAAANYTADQVATAFDTLVSLLGDASGGGSVGISPATDPVRSVMLGGTANVGDANTAFADARAKRFQRFETAHRGAVAPTVQ